jgi:hypothetical protein
VYIAPRGMPRLIITATRPIIVPSIFRSCLFLSALAPIVVGTAVDEGTREVWKKFRCGANS